MNLFSKCCSCAMPRMSLVLLPVVLLLGVLSASATQKPPSNVTGVSVSGNKILINGSQGTLNGFTFVGVANPTPCASNMFSTAASAWGATELSDAQSNFEANAIRIQVAQDLIYEPSSQNFSSTVISSYITRVGNAVALARSKGLAVIVSMQWESGASGTSVCDGTSKTNYGHYGVALTGNPTTDNTSAAWSALLGSSAWKNNTTQGAARNFNTDTGVLLEVYNEPTLGMVDGGAASWTGWQTALQSLVTAIRGDGANNVLIIPGLAGEKILDATPYGGKSVVSYLLTDTKNSLIYGVHPYPITTTGTTYTIGYFTSQDWNYYFGNVAKTTSMTAPVMVTEWFTGGKDQSLCWDTLTPKQPSPLPWNFTIGTTFNSATITHAFMTWLETAAPTGSSPNSAPMSFTGAWPFDAPGYIAQDLSNYDPTTLPSDSSFQCNVQVTGADGTLTYPGPGNAITNYFTSY